MNYRNKLYVLLMCFVLCCISQQSWAQMSAQQSQEMQLIKTATEASPMTFTYAETPALCFGRLNKNPFAKYTSQQLQVLSDFDYPKFVSRGYEFIEADVAIYKQAQKSWEAKNQARAQEFRSRMQVQ